MNKTNVKIASFILSAILAGTFLSACGAGLTEEKETSTSENSTVQNEISQDAYQIKLEYYQKLTEDLESEILSIKEENFLEVCEYKLQIEALQAQISDLNDKISGNSPSTDNNGTANQPSNQNPNQNLNQNDNQNQLPNTENISGKEETEALPFTYIENNGEITVTSYTGTKKSVVVPSQIDGHKVTAIGENAFSGTSVEEIILSDGIKTIDWFAFCGCYTLRCVSIPSSVESVGYGAFDGCPSSIVIKCKKGSYIESYALSWGMLCLAS